MHGWISVALIAVAEASVAIILLRRAVHRWWDWAPIALLAALLVLPTLKNVTGDMSIYFPAAIWSGDSSDSKDQIIWASIVSTLLLPVIAAAFCVLLVRHTWRAFKVPRE